MWKIERKRREDLSTGNVGGIGKKCEEQNVNEEERKLRIAREIQGKRRWARRSIGEKMEGKYGQREERDEKERRERKGREDRREGKGRGLIAAPHTSTLMSSLPSAVD